jgi:beta-galactosidase
MSDLTRRDLFRTGIAASVAATVASAQSPAPPGADTIRERLSLDFGWKFHLGHADDPEKDFNWGKSGSTFAKSGITVPAAQVNFDDSAWRKLDLPHDWAIELPFENDPNLKDHGFHPIGRAYPATSIGWYRRVFTLSAADLGRRIAIEFDGVYRDSIVIVNGHYLGRNFSGYAPFRYDITDQANYGAPTVVVVRVDATLGDGWFYEGAGIYRHVWLTKTNPVHVPQWGTFVRSTVRPGGGASLLISTDVENETDIGKLCHLSSKIVDPAGKTVATHEAAPLVIPARSGRTFVQSIEVGAPALWSVDDPKLYRLETALESDGPADQVTTHFGIRSVRFDADKGFFLNEKPVKLKGTCNHQDFAGVGAALPDRIQYYRIERLKEMGSNAYRTSHNPPTPELVDACDELGMLMMCETRLMDSTPEALSQLERMVRCHRNHPSIVIWSVGNEEPEQGTERGARIEATMKRVVKAHDDSRPVTQAMNYGWGGNGATRVLDVQGFNYNESRIDQFHKDYPTLPMVGTETASTVATRGIYFNDKEKGYVRAYDLEHPPWAALAEFWWKFYDARPFLAGGFVWTGFDYRGEPTPYGWPCVNSHFGIMDMCGFPKDNFYYYQAWWTSRPVLHLFPHWNWEGKEGQEIEVWVHSNLDRVELFLNGESQGMQSVGANTHLMWKVKYKPGVIVAKGYKGLQEVLSHKRETSGPAAKILLRADRRQLWADGVDVALVTVEIVDSQDRPVATAGNELTFQVNGGGRLLGLGNGDPSSHELDTADKRHAFNGLCVALVQTRKSADEILVQATSPGLETGRVSLTTATVPLHPAVP